MMDRFRSTIVRVYAQKSDGDDREHLTGNREQFRSSTTAKFSDSQGKNISILRQIEPKTLHPLNNI
ncbi:MAG: hypothetical protein F6K54_39160 [Okeania sp. SIO3B5]|uniref:hypothetical protein n=1 Tax=Okeania sp. SIO3B5 TaxID=2607811 RepID=UPI0013FF3FE9|nr:hypothetical protein [Okeania sp. SIO3B5]NEO58548.1 hypothetical protein [Okeania sp. SIO3B5]